MLEGFCSAMTSQTDRLAYILTGPCGVGKSTIADLMASSYEITHLEFDKIRLNDAKKRKGIVSPCSISFLDLERCLKEALTQYAQGFVLDVGGDSVFRQDKNNDERLQQMLWLKSFFGAQVVVLFAQNRFCSKDF
ncbi:MAG: hypothetical protein R3C62_16885 [Chloroflexota bacterium]